MEAVAMRAERCCVCSANIEIKPEHEVSNRARCDNCADTPEQYNGYGAAQANDNSVTGDGDGESGAAQFACQHCGGNEYRYIQTQRREVVTDTSTYDRVDEPLIYFDTYGVDWELIDEVCECGSCGLAPRHLDWEN